jgi:hypothetical protein
MSGAAAALLKSETTYAYFRSTHFGHLGMPCHLGNLLKVINPRRINAENFWFCIEKRCFPKVPLVWRKKRLFRPFVRKDGNLYWKWVSLIGRRGSER